jgi:hypothetical protein
LRTAPATLSAAARPGRLSYDQHARLALPYILTQQAQKEVAHAAGLNRLDALVKPVAQQVGLNAPPGSPADGQCWIVGTSLAGAWSAQANRLAQRIGGAWVFHARL